MSTVAHRRCSLPRSQNTHLFVRTFQTERIHYNENTIWDSSYAEQKAVIELISRPLRHWLGKSTYLQRTTLGLIISTFGASKSRPGRMRVTHPAWPYSYYLKTTRHLLKTAALILVCLPMTCYHSNSNELNRPCAASDYSLSLTSQPLASYLVTAYQLPHEPTL